MKYFKCLLSLSFMVVLFCTACSQPSSDATDATNTETNVDATYTVTYVDGVDGAEIAVPSDTNQYKAGDSVTVKFTDSGNREYYSFAGWSDGSTTYTSSGTTTFTMGNANVTLTAQWQWNNSFIGTKPDSVQKEVGDIVFNDGSAMPYTTFATLDTSAKNEKKAKAIALIFYKGTGLNSEAPGTPVTSDSRTLGVGLKHNKTGLKWCRGEWVQASSTVINNANGYNYNNEQIKCQYTQSGTEYDSFTITGDKNGIDNLEAIAQALGNDNDTGVGGSATDLEHAALNYPAFYFAKNYKNIAGSNVNGTSYESGWYLPSIAELYQIYVTGKSASKEFDIDAVIYALGGDKFEDGFYLSSSGVDDSSTSIYSFNFIGVQFPWNEQIAYVFRASKAEASNVCCIREF